MPSLPRKRESRKLREKGLRRQENTLLRREGGRAAGRADELLEVGNMDGLATWKQILRAVDDLLAKERPEGAAVH